MSSREAIDRLSRRLRAPHAPGFGPVVGPVVGHPALDIEGEHGFAHLRAPLDYAPFDYTTDEAGEAGEDLPATGPLFPAPMFTLAELIILAAVATMGTLLIWLSCATMAVR